MRNTAHVSIILDKSGSMSSVAEKTISGLNEYFQTLKNDKETDYTIDLVLFDEGVQNVYRNRALSEVKLLSSEDYRPNNSTALYDAVCDTLLGREAGTPSKWIVVIMTDGEENASKRHNETELRDYVKLLKGTGWVQFVFLGANQDSFSKAQRWNFDKGNIANFNATDKGVTRSFAAMAMNTVQTSSLDWSAQGNSSFFNKDQQADLDGTI